MKVIFCACLLWATAHAQPTSFHGHISGYTIASRDSVTVDFWPSFIDPSIGFGAHNFSVPVSKSGNFSFDLPPLTHPGRSSDHTLEIEAHAEASTGTGAKATNQRHLRFWKSGSKTSQGEPSSTLTLSGPYLLWSPRDDPNPSGSPSQPLLMSNGSSKPPAPDIL